LVAGRVPLRNVRKDIGRFTRKAYPDQAIFFLNGIRVQAQLGRNDGIRVGRNFHALALAIVAKTVIFADNVPFLAPAHRQRNAAMQAEIIGGHHALACAIENQFLVEQRGGNRLIDNLAGNGNRVPKVGEDSPVGFRKSAVSGKRPFVGRRRRKSKSLFLRFNRGVHRKILTKCSCVPDQGARAPSGTRWRFDQPGCEPPR